jgi:hypothetical protein
MRAGRDDAAAGSMFAASTVGDSAGVGSASGGEVSAAFFVCLAPNTGRTVLLRRLAVLAASALAGSFRVERGMQLGYPPNRRAKSSTLALS